MKPVAIFDFGHSQHRVGFAGNLEPDVGGSEVFDGKSVANLRSFLRASAAKFHPEVVVFVEKNQRDTRLREEAAQILFEECLIRNLFFLRSGVAALFAVGRSTGVTLELSESAHELVEVEDGFIDQNHLFVGRVSPLSLYKSARENHSKLSLSEFRKALMTSGPTVSLPDGAELSLEEFNLDCADLIHKGVSKLPGHKTFTFTGRGYHCPLLRQSILTPLQKLNPKILNSPESPSYKPISFTGASIVASLADLVELSVSAAVYKEAGPLIFNKVFH